MDNIRSKYGRIILNLLPRYSKSLNDLCSRYVDRYNGDNNSDSETNGEYAFLRKVLPAIGEGVVFDVGANVGNWASFALLVNKSLHLHCFEPCKSTFGVLSATYWPPSIRLNNFGFSESVGVAELNIFNSTGLNSLYTRRGVEHAVGGRREQISLSTVDNYCQGNNIQTIDLLKVDVEGHELSVFKGMSRMLSAGKVKRIQFEYGGCNLDAKIYLADIWDFLSAYQLKFYKLFPGGPRPVIKYQQKLETFVYSNWVCALEGFEP